MKHHRALSIIAAVLLIIAVLPGTAMAEEMEVTLLAQETPPAVAVYPAEVRTSEENGMIRLERVYHLSTSDDPAAIPTEDFEREGRTYTLLDILKNDLSETDTKDYVEVITQESSTKDMSEIIKNLEPELEIVTEDGYTGILKPDYTKITVEAAGYKTNSWTVSATRTYPNLSDADTSLIPKTIEDGGRTLTLADVDWQEANTDYVDGTTLAAHYTGVAVYTGTATSRNPTGYTVTVDYSGEVTKTSCDTVIYTAIFSAENASHGETYSEAETETATATKGHIAGKIVIVVVAGIAALALIGYIGWRAYKYIRDKKRGYV